MSQWWVDNHQLVIAGTRCFPSSSRGNLRKTEVTTLTGMKSPKKCCGHSHGLVAVCTFQVLHQVQVIISEGAFEEASVKISALWRNSLSCVHLHWTYSFIMNVYFVSEVCVLWTSNILSLQNVIYFRCMGFFDAMRVECNSVY